MSAAYPDTASHSRRNWESLSGFWHPVARSADVAEGIPLGATLLDVPVVLYRIAGTITAAIDRCPHRGTRLSLGRIDNGNLICPYHGIGFDQKGACRVIPSRDYNQDSFEYLDIETFQSEERYGLVWVCLSDTPSMPLPDWSEALDPGNQSAVIHAVWEASAGRHIENFCDLAHFPFAHAASFGVAGKTDVPDFPIERSNHGFSFAVDVPMRLGEDDASVEMVRSEYDITLPFASRMTMRHTAGNTSICDVASPISLGRSGIFMIIARDHDQHEDIDLLIGAQHAVNEEDRFMVESQWPVGLPVTGRVERHLSTDRFSVVYRKWWASLGLSDPI